MSNFERTRSRNLLRPALLSLIGIVLIIPIPLLAGDPQLAPAWLSQKIAGVPLLPILVLGLMGSLVAVALLNRVDAAAPDGAKGR